MTLEEVLTSLHLTESADAIRPEWDLSQTAMPTGDIDFLAPDFLRTASRDAHLPIEAGEAAVAAAQRISNSSDLARLMWHFHYRLYHSGTPVWDDIGGWPTLGASLDADAGAFYLVLLLSNIPDVLALHRSHGVPPEVTRDTLLDIENSLGNEEGHRGPDSWGFSPGNVAWLRYHTGGDLYRLGRFQFQYGTLEHRIRVFQHTTSRAVVALCEDGVHYLPDGGVTRSSEVRGAWMSSLELTDDEAIGNPIMPTGHARPRTVRLPLVDWGLVLAKGDPVLHIHIPSGGPMSHELCGESLRSALDFFPRHFPERPFTAFSCGSWILDAGLESLLPPTSNLVRFQREVYLVPTGIGDDSVLRNVFDGVPVDLSQAPRDTSLQRAILSVLHSGRSLPTGGGGCFLLPEDFDWGSQVYRRQKLPLAID
jgi:hypothetical protein